MAGRVPDHEVGHPVAVQSWRDVSFLHWALEPEVVARVLPDGLTVDTFDGRAWLSLIPFRVVTTRVSLPLRPSVAGSSRARHHLEVRPGTELPADDVASAWLCGRWRAWTSAARHWFAVPIEHQPWPLAEARATVVDESLVVAAGLPAPGAPDLVHFSGGVDAKIGLPTLARR